MKDEEIQGLIESNVFERERCDSRKIPLFDDNVAALRQLRDEVKALREDARRYRIIRDSDALAFSVDRDDHKTVYETAAQHNESQPLEAINEEQHAKMLAEDRIWRVQVYPNTPVGYISAEAADLDVLIDALEQEVSQ